MSLRLYLQFSYLYLCHFDFAYEKRENAAKAWFGLLKKKVCVCVCVCEIEYAQSGTLKKVRKKDCKHFSLTESPE